MRARDFDGVVREILNEAGVAERSFPVRLSSDIPTAAATGAGGRSVILYNPAFVAKLGTTARTGWAIVFLFAHEISHHLLGHPAREPADRDDEAMELEADKWSGFILAGLGASLEETRLSIESLASLVDTIRPGAEVRLAVVERGWRTGARAAAPGPQTNP